MLRLTLKPSRLVATAITFAHAAAIPIVAVVDLPSAARAGLALVVVGSFVRAMWRHGLLRGGYAIIALEVTAQGDVAVLARDGEWREARVLGSTYLGWMLTVISVRVAGCFGPRHVLLVKDNCEPDAFRRLRAYLRWGYINRPGSDAVTVHNRQLRPMRLNASAGADE